MEEGFMDNQWVRRFEGQQAVQELLRQMKTGLNKRPKIRVIYKDVLGKLHILEGVTVRNHVLMHPDKPGEHSIFHVADMYKSKSGQPLAQRVAWPHESINPNAVNLFPLAAVEIC
jgi:hypothetical protein